MTALKTGDTVTFDAEDGTTATGTVESRGAFTAMVVVTYPDGNMWGTPVAYSRLRKVA